jgi:two-component system response regulator BaeR
MEMPTRAVNRLMQKTLHAASCDVLIVEDDIVLSDVIVSYLARRGLIVRSAHTGSAALRLLERVYPRVVVLDYRLPGQSGLELARALLERCGRLPIIMMSGSIPGLDKDALEAAGIRIFVNKPIPLAALHRAVLQLLGQTEPGL